MNNKKVYLVGGRQYNEYLNWIYDLGYELTNDLNESSLVFFAGGSDCQPSLYGESEGKYTYTNPQRDLEELDIWNKSKDIPKIGICRGNQFLSITNGYKLTQHINHPSYHLIKTIDNKSLMVSSSHHQLVLLQPGTKFKQSVFELIGWSDRLSDKHLNGDNIDYHFAQDYKEPEIVLYQSESFGTSLGIQMHPEYLDINDESVQYCQKLVKENLQ
jgi:gamma-glutamyl-gamma-aminobutyrate hydrolase PuuD